MTSPLERRYRRALRVLPRWYRDRWEDEMVSSFMEGAYASEPDADLVDVGRPRFGELLSVVRLGLRLRLGGDGAPPRAVAWGEVVYRLALLGALFYAAIDVVVAGRRVLRPLSRIDPGMPDGIYPWLWQLFEVRWLFGLFWVGAFLALLGGWIRPARWMALTAYGLPLAADVAVSVWGSPPVTGPLWSVDAIPNLLWHGVPLVAVLLVQRAAPTRRWPWLLALAALALLALPSVIVAANVVGPLFDIEGLACVGAIAAIVAVLVTGAIQGAASPTWLLALAAWAVWAAGNRLTGIHFFATVDGISDRFVVIGLVEVALALVAAAVAAIVGIACIRRLAPWTEEVPS